MNLEKAIKIVASRANSFEELMISGKNWVNKLEELGVLKPQMKILDFGAGVGRFSINLSRYNVTAIDRNDYMVEILKNNSIEVYQSEDLTPVLGNRFDLVIAMFVFQHIGRKKVEKILKQIKQVSNSILFTLPTEYKSESYKSQSEGKNEVHTESEVSYVYTEKEIKDLFKGYKLERLNVKNENVFLATI